ncbi:MAG: Mu transposase C-terminal domain-containing protein [Ignavibacteriales bacterium]|nr:MAG: transposase [Ignavibacteriaceae bacterium]MBW7872864.1 Mu transposase C-terminal domain-containing protein [Ignavibacteria bacterium]MCZ2143584.1 Mu transposase C-terminal domain-containing protein [Ignavibacteriales bacterium]MBV6444459.1 hypothetical protein [Ignavibacteriaceae bacterium]MBZ0197264.1 Mu transposase C-terminal domain-containing protein [Ignavibacteriaceae bacterium]
MREDRYPVFAAKMEWSFAEFAETRGLTYEAIKKMAQRNKLPEGYEVYSYSDRKKVIRFVGIKAPQALQQPQPERVQLEKITREEIARKNTVKEWVKFRESAKKAGTTYAVADENFILHFNELKMYPAEYAILGEVSIPTLYRWLSLYQTGEIRPALMGRKLGDTLSQTEKQLLERFWLMPECHSKEACIRYTIKALQEQGFTDIKSSKTYQRHLTEYTKLNYSTVMMCRRGRKAMIDNTVPALSRDHARIDVGDMLVLDGHTTNFEILNPATGKPQRMTLLMVVEAKTGLPVGFEIMPTENVYAITSAIRRAILTLKFKPKVILLDNGRANRSVGKQTKNQTDWYRADDLSIGRGILERIGIATIFAKPYNAQAKVVERFFSDFLEFEKQMPTYTGNSIDRKPARLLRNEKLHRALYAEKLEYMGGGITIEQAIISIAIWVNEYAKREITSGRNKGRTRGELFTEGVNKIYGSEEYQTRVATRLELDELMTREEVRTLYRNGIRFRGRYYWNDVFFRLERGEGKHRFMIRYDLIDPTRIWVYDKKGFVCEAMEPEMQHPAARLLGTDEDRPKLEAALKQQQALVSAAEREATEKLSGLLVPVDISQSSRGATATKLKLHAKRKQKNNREKRVLEPPKTAGVFDWAEHLLPGEELKEQLKNRS